MVAINQRGFSFSGLKLVQLGGLNEFLVGPRLWGSNLISINQGGILNQRWGLNLKS